MKPNTAPDADTTAALVGFIKQQSQAGLQPDEIKTQLQQAGWKAELIKQGFERAQTMMMPNFGKTGANATSVRPVGLPAVERGRFKTGWLLFKESWKILRQHRGLTRYIAMSVLWTAALGIVTALGFYFGRHVFFTHMTDINPNAKLTPLGYAATFVYYSLNFFIVNLYSAALVANVIDLFHGKQASYKEYIDKARKRAGALFLFSLIQATVGLVLRIMSERSRLIGQIASAIIGAAWNVAQLFVVPLLITTDESPFKAIGSSTRLVVATWGENIVGRISFGFVETVTYILVLTLDVALVIGGYAAFGIWGAIIGVAIAVFTMVIAGVVFSAAYSILNTALFYYATNHQVPPAFDAALINVAMRTK